jgi:hypothetical protein
METICYHKENTPKETFGMTRGEKIGGIILGTALFAGLFYLIYDSFITGGAPYADEALYADDAGDFGLEDDLGAELEDAAETQEPAAAK